MCDNLCAFVDYFQPVKIMRTNTVCSIIIFMLVSMYTLYKTHKVIFRKHKITTSVGIWKDRWTQLH